MRFWFSDPRREARFGRCKVLPCGHQHQVPALAGGSEQEPSWGLCRSQGHRGRARGVSSQARRGAASASSSLAPRVPRGCVSLCELHAVGDFSFPRQGALSLGLPCGATPPVLMIAILRRGLPKPQPPTGPGTRGLCRDIACDPGAPEPAGSWEQSDLQPRGHRVPRRWLLEAQPSRGQEPGYKRSLKFPCCGISYSHVLIFSCERLSHPPPPIRASHAQ